MDWFSVGDCSAAYRFGWLIGTASGLYAQIIVTILIVTAPAYHPDVPRAVSATVRTRSQWILIFAQAVLLVVWLAGAARVGWEYLPCFVTTVALGAVAVIAPIMLLLLFTSANWVGTASAR